jgi:hypothetical protein
MRLIEIIAALCVMAAAFPPLASGLRPLYATYSDVTVQQRDLDAARFVSASFAAQKSEQEIETWALLVEQMTGTAPAVWKIAESSDAELYRAEWTFGGQSRWMDIIFYRRKS